NSCPVAAIAAALIVAALYFPCGCRPRGCCGPPLSSGTQSPLVRHAITAKFAALTRKSWIEVHESGGALASGNSRAFSVPHCPRPPEEILQLIADRDEPLSVGQLVAAVVRFRQRSERDPDAQREAFELPDCRLVEELLFEREFLKPLEGDRIVVP